MEKSEQLRTVAAGIVTYNPNIDKLRLNIDALVNQVGAVYIIDNASSNFFDIQKLCKEINHAVNIIQLKLIQNPINKGIATALNQLFNCAEQNDYSWLLTLDQDSRMQIGSVEWYLDYATDFASIISLRTDRFAGENLSENGEVEEIRNCITSGNMVRVSVWRSIGGFNENLFIDMVDVDFCYRLHQEKYRIARINRIGYTHEMGSNNGYVKFFGKKHFTGNYNALRKYYIFRNMVYVIRKYQLKGQYYSYKRLLMLTVATVLFEPDKVARLSSELKGFIDGFIKFNQIASFEIEGENMKDLL